MPDQVVRLPHPDGHFEYVFDLAAGTAGITFAKEPWSMMTSERLLVEEVLRLRRELGDARDESLALRIQIAVERDAFFQAQALRRSGLDPESAAIVDRIIARGKNPQRPEEPVAESAPDKALRAQAWSDLINAPSVLGKQVLSDANAEKAPEWKAVDLCASPGPPRCCRCGEEARVLIPGPIAALFSHRCFSCLTTYLSSQHASPAPRQDFEQQPVHPQGVDVGVSGVPAEASHAEGEVPEAPGDKGRGE